MSALVLAVGVSVVVLAAVVDPTPVRLTATSPADGAVLSAPPTEYALRFSGAVAPREVHVSVGPADGGPATMAGEPRRDGDRIVVPLTVSAPGGYLVAYHLLLLDGTEISGIDRFTVAPPGGATTSGVDAPAPPSDDAPPSDAAGGHAHAATDPFSLVLLGLNLVLIVVAIAILLRRPGRAGGHPRRPG
ncbi:hypothetical protein GA0070616_4956 [Micromonospora nigra]|uniref:CopC domain-containing protein n=1 Tax=Micromonospora nigra TaxID=145857 RepID=A0A1C6SXW0_9ACTN|nr:copper resistance CopC family protein [Micromonospora nigra]SCL34386.1 hypothetical protein GA0070616_4956 [Micromonospora nigra]